MDSSTERLTHAARGPATWCLLAALLFGASTPVTKVLLEGLGPFTLAGLLYLGAALAVVPMAFSGGPPSLARGRRNLLLLGGAVLFGGIIGPVLLLLSLQRASASSVSLWLNLETVGTAVLAWLFFKEDIGARTWLAVALVLAGGVALAIPPEPSTLVAVALIAGAALCWGLDNNLTSLIDGFTPAQSTLAKGAIAGSVNLGLGLSFEGLPALSGPGTWTIVAALVVGGLGYGVSLVLYVRGAQHLGATRSQLLFAAAPFFGLLLSWLALGEPVLFVQLLAGALMAGGLALMLSAPHSHHHVHEATRHTHSHRHDDGHHDHEHEGLPASHRHTHEHEHEAGEHSHPHRPDLHHRHEH
jgi:drug/metabolite transporter (DMT)-like permease